MMRSGFSLLFLLWAVGCTSVTHREYRAFERNLDGKNELRISTFPDFFPSDTSSTPLMEKLETHDQLNFEIFVRDIRTKFGENPNIESIVIHSFAYRMGDGPKMQLLTNYGQNYWQQGNSRYDAEDRPPIPYRRDAVVSIEIELTVNGTRHSFQGEMPAHEYRTIAPRFLRNLTM